MVFRDAPTPPVTQHTLDMPYDEAFERLLENLQMRWNWGFFFTDSYIDEDDRYVYTVIGTAKVKLPDDSDSREYGFVVKVKQDSKSRALVSISTHYLDYSGWPASQMGRIVNHTRHLSIVDKLLEYCVVPHGQGSGLADMFRRMVRNIRGNPTTRRKH